MLGGWCAHGPLAYEIARQLLAQLQPSANEIIIKRPNAGRLKGYTGLKRVIARAQFKFHLLKFERAYLKHLNKAQARDYIAGRVSKKLSRIKESLRQAVRIKKSGPGDFYRENPLEVLYRAAANYRPRPCEGHVTLIRSSERTVGFGRELDLGWKEVLGEQIEIRETPGNHYTIYMHPNVDALAHKMNELLCKA